MLLMFYISWFGWKWGKNKIEELINMIMTYKNKWSLKLFAQTYNMILFSFKTLYSVLSNHKNETIY